MSTAAAASADRQARDAEISVKAMVRFGYGSVVAGGLIAAITEPLALHNGSWLVAYLVLVCGVSSYAIGSAQLNAGRLAIPPKWARAQFACWLIGNMAVIVGTLGAIPILVYVAVLPLYLALATALTDSARPRRRPDRWPASDYLSRHHRGAFRSQLITWTYRALLLVLAMSIPIGAVLAHLRDASVG